MHVCATKRIVTLSAVLASLAFAGCGTPSFDSFLPSVWPTGLKTVFEQSGSFTEPTTGEITSARPGATIDPISSLIGCWGGYTPNYTGEAEGTPINLYQSFTFRADGTFSWSILNEVPGVLPLVFVQEGRYEFQSPNVLKIIDATINAYAPSSQSYVPLTNDPPASFDMLVTLAGDLLRLEYATADSGSDSFGIVPILKKFNCN